MKTEIITLIKPTETRDAYGDPVTTETSRIVFTEALSIGQKEFYQAMATGLQPELKFRLSDYLDYNDEPIAEYKSIRYRILRTYRNGQTLELTVTREVNPA